MQAFEIRAQTANPRPIIPPADKLAGVYFFTTQGTNFQRAGKRLKKHLGMLATL
jgi:hypothetical protein